MCVLVGCVGDGARQGQHVADDCCPMVAPPLQHGMSLRAFGCEERLMVGESCFERPRGA